ncbi:hypothetical protein RIF29_09765 [Crotalaria pallida]|uniref:Uncharacterized protein n=1 Tax=Crotalaria pallida TaxID=3830 RepID=A0AAN9IKM3_CROPI
MKDIQHVANALNLKKDLEAELIPEDNIDCAIAHVEAVIGSGAPLMKTGANGAGNGATGAKGADGANPGESEPVTDENKNEGWTTTDVHGYMMFQVCRKLDLLKQPLLAFNKSHFSGIVAKEMDLKSRLEFIQGNLMQNPSDIALQIEAKSILQEYILDR